MSATESGGESAAKACEKLRRGVDFDHWASFGYSFDLLRGLIAELGSGSRGGPPASIVVLSGDVHYAYLAEVGFPAGEGIRALVFQAACSPYRNPLSTRERAVIRAAFSRPMTAATRALARAAGAPAPGIGWRLLHGPFFDNQVASLVIEGRGAVMRLEKTVAGDSDERRLECVFEQPLA